MSTMVAHAVAHVHGHLGWLAASARPRIAAKPCIDEPTLRVVSAENIAVGFAGSAYVSLFV